MSGMKRVSIRRDQSGMAAITIVLILMIVISLTVLSFAKIIRREQESALNDQLSSRAFYAAESGINIAKQALNNSAAATTYAAAPKTNCGSDVYITNAQLALDAASQTEVSCLTIDTAQDTLLYSVSQNHSQSIPLNGSAPITSVTLTWQSTSANGSENYNTCSARPLPNNPAYGSWNCPAPALRVDLVPADSANLTRANLTNRLFTVFMIPRDNSTAATVSASYDNSSTGANQGLRLDTVHCNGNSRPYACSARITNLFNGLSSRTGYLRIASYYGDSLVSVSAQAGGATVELSGAQATIDSTGRALDVVRRVQARVPLAEEFAYPDAGVLGTAGLCKVYERIPGATVPVVQNGAAATFALDPTNTCL